MPLEMDPGIVGVGAGNGNIPIGIVTALTEIGVVVGIVTMIVIVTMSVIVIATATVIMIATVIVIVVNPPSSAVKHATRPAGAERGAGC